MIPLTLLAGYWQLALGGLVALALSITLAVRTQERNAAQAGWAAEKIAFAQTVSDFRAATAKAQADDLAHARAVETRDATINKESSDALFRQLADARALADTYARRLRPRASAGHLSGGGAAGVPPAPGTPGDALGAGETAFVPIPRDDLDTCTVNSIKAAGWRDWWLSVSAAPR